MKLNRQARFALILVAAALLVAGLAGPVRRAAESRDKARAADEMRQQFERERVTRAEEYVGRREQVLADARAAIDRGDYAAALKIVSPYALGSRRGPARAVPRGGRRREHAATSRSHGGARRARLQRGERPQRRSRRCSRRRSSPGSPASRRVRRCGSRAPRHARWCSPACASRRIPSRRRPGDRARADRLGDTHAPRPSRPPAARLSRHGLLARRAGRDVRLARRGSPLPGRAHVRLQRSTSGWRRHRTSRRSPPTRCATSSGRSEAPPVPALRPARRCASSARR